MGSPLRVLHVVVNMNRGGAETLLMNLYRNIDRSKIQFDFLTCKEGVFDEEILKLGGKVYRIPYITEVGHSKYLKALTEFFIEYPQYQIVHSHMDKMSGFVLRAAKKAGVSVRIAHSHSTRSEGGAAARIYKWYAGTMIPKYATDFVSCSKEAAEWLFGKKANGTIFLKNGIDLDKFKFSPKVRELIRSELKMEKDQFLVGHVGRFSMPKNHSYLLELFKEFLSYRREAILLLVGDGPLLPEIKRKAEEMELSKNIKFLGSRSDVEQLLQAFDVFLFPSIFEGVPVSLIEAQASGLPCLISDSITKEIDMGLGLVHSISLTNKKLWIERMQDVINQHSTRNSNVNSLISDNGYDIKNASGYLQKFYSTVTGDVMNEEVNGVYANIQ
ncbi:glycosyltransferase family 1 protein [Mesobacillus sp. AQ2]|uniref:glycosyltransferase family 1 protein n=1 Tax=Mesobacillus sp. AQ2 TaxID=3043332 RepID=UPI0024C1B70E|nr:glycosyltransferase family 1 protein [Mesobacillus sp. AQ2]WHX41416.1 glycosyltransferase family 1 protein [Mesobacillus sp. AQ2]